MVVIAGPTASGKSALALDAAEAFSGTVINADSMQVYRELRILTARPPPADEDRAPHRLFGVLSATERCSAGRWLDLAAAAIDETRAAGRLPIVVGGTGLYLRALLEGLAPVPEIADTVRAEARTLHERLGDEAFHAELARIDPQMAARLPAADGQRLIRAFEVVKATGRSLADWQGQEKAHQPVAGRFATIVLNPPRDDLYAAIDARFEDMIEAGALDEVAALEELKLDPSLPASKALGVAPLGRYLRGEMDLDEARRAAKQASRNYAKRQCTWLGNQMAGANLYPAQYSQRLQSRIFSFIRQFLLTADT
ncbi:MAG: tRNA (adenosine(37)-N6)-dimethylallyltransferase MiaA [Rhodospirillales bacterium]|nr:tRNA (adenosine(37)-N6)-dimethylallyltransferase MiaA [Rhodospirillales bacterium]MDP6883375.1 tRNA (adenosine(37)-N6)-dimethylallyltransferase MiaA [Rhodospirillales bacterium]